MNRNALGMLAAMAVCLLAPTALAVTVDFETVTPGTTWGTASGNAAGDVVLTQHGIDMSVEDFVLTVGSFSALNEAAVPGSFAAHFPTKPLELNNISVLFDFTGAPWNVGEVSLQYVDLGGEKNLSVNGEPIVEMHKLSSAPVNIAPGVTAHVSEKTITGGVRGSLILKGPIELLQIGGQELAIDDVHASPADTKDKPDGDGSPNDNVNNGDGNGGPGNGDGPQGGGGPAGGNDDPFTIEIGDVVLNLCGAGAAPALAMCLAGLVTLRIGFRRR